MRKIICLTAIALMVALPGWAQTLPDDAGPLDAQKKDLILRFIDVFGTRGAMTQNLEIMLGQLPPDKLELQKLKESIKVDEIIDLLVPLYDRQFSTEDLKAFIAFYSSPAGQKLMRAIPVIMRQSVDVSTQYFEEKLPQTK